MSTLKDISLLAGVSLSTVSRVLNGRDSVDEDLKGRVLSAAKQLNYTPNLAARSLRTRNTKLIGMVSEGNTNYMFSHIINYISDYCTDLGYGFIMANHHNNPDREEMIFRSMKQRGVDGLILSLVSKQSHIIPDIISSDIPIVIFDRYLVFDQISTGEKNFSVTLDNYTAGKLAAEYLVGLGHRKIALAEGPQEVDLTRLRTSGFFDGLADAGQFVPMNYRFKGGFDFESGRTVAQNLLKLGTELPTAIWCENDNMAAGLISELSLSGLRVPQDISVLGMDNIELSKMISPSLSTVEQPYHEMAIVSVDMILGKHSLHGNKAVFSPKIIERDSCRPYKGQH